MSRKFSFARSTIAEAVQHAVESLYVPSNSKYKGKLRGKTLRISKDSVAKKCRVQSASMKKSKY